MEECGYLAETTAKREDCMLSYTGFLHPIFAYLSSDWDKSFAGLLENEKLSEFIVLEGQKHRARGVTAEMFFGCFKTLIHTVEEIITDAEPFSTEQKVEAILTIRKFSDAAETLMLKDWVSRQRDEVIDDYAKTNRQLTLDKNMYENIFDATADLVVIADEDGQVVELNRPAKNFFGEKYDGRFWNMLGEKHDSLTDFLAKYPVGEAHEIVLSEQSKYFSLRIVPLKRISLASLGHMIIMSDITCMADQRAKLEEMVAERTQALESEKSRAWEMNITLKNVLNSIDNEKQVMEKNLYENIKNVLLPAIEKLKDEKDPKLRTAYADTLTSSLLNITESAKPDFASKMVLLSRTELQICNYIKAGLSGKDICDLMNISYETIQTHRKNIRNKLGLKGEKINLYTYLIGKNSPENGQ